MLETGKTVRIIKKTMYVFGIIFLVATAVFLLKIVNGDTCGREDYTEYSYGAVQAAVTLDTANSVVYQHNPFPRDKNIDEWRFCFTTNATSAVELHVVNSRDDILGHAIIEDGYHNHCYNIIFPENETFNYLGLACPACSNADPEVTFYEEIIGAETERVVEEGNVFTTSDENTLDWVLRGYPSCWESIKYFTYWYLTLAVIMSILIGLVYGSKKTKEVVMRD